jgi:hypothetical protein
MTSADDRIEELREDLVRFLIASNGSDGLNVRVARVVNASLDDLRKGGSANGGSLPELLVHLRGQRLRHEVVVLAQVWHLGWRLAVDRESGALLSAVVRRVATSKLDPLWKSADGGGKP